VNIWVYQKGQTCSLREGEELMGLKGSSLPNAQDCKCIFQVDDDDADDDWLLVASDEEN
jgi:hypothetical protein